MVNFCLERDGNRGRKANIEIDFKVDLFYRTACPCSIRLELLGLRALGLVENRAGRLEHPSPVEYFASVEDPSIDRGIDYL